MPNKKTNSVVSNPLSSKYGVSSNSAVKSGGKEPDRFFCFSLCLSACKSNCKSECASACASNCGKACASACKSACRAQCQSLCYGAGSDANSKLDQQVKSVEDIIL